MLHTPFSAIIYGYTEFHIGHISYGLVSNMHVIALSLPFMIVKEIILTVENYYVSWDYKVYVKGLP